MKLMMTIINILLLFNMKTEAFAPPEPPLSAARLLSTKGKNDAPVEVNDYFFVDTNIISKYLSAGSEMPERDAQALTAFVNQPTRRFFFTETVEAELSAVKQDLQLEIPDHTFIKIQSGIDHLDKKAAIARLAKILFARKNMILTNRQQEKFLNYFSIVFEAGFCCYDDNVVPANFQPLLLTNNLKFIKKFLQNPEDRDCVEAIVNLHGFEHLIEVIALTDALAFEEANQIERKPILVHYIGKYDAA